MKYIKLFEYFKDKSQMTFRVENNGDEIIIKSFIKDDEVGSITFEFIDSGYDYFSDIISEDKYDELFPSNDFVEITNFNVNENFRRRGYSKKLMKQCLSYIKSIGKSTVYLNASPVGISGLNLYHLVKFYESFGFKTFYEEPDSEEMILNY